MRRAPLPPELLGGFKGSDTSLRCLGRVRRRRRAALLLSAALLAALALLTLFKFSVRLPTLDSMKQLGARHNYQPYCRKSSSIVVLARAPRTASVNTSDSFAAKSNGTQAAADGAGVQHAREQGLHLVTWSGIGEHKSIFEDLSSFDLASRTWRPLRPTHGPAPVSRWKAGNAQAVDNGLVVVGGDAYTPHTLRHKYKNDIWRLDYESLRWAQAQVDPAGKVMEPRRGHSTVHYKDVHGVDHIVVFGGRTKGDKVLFNDAWDVALTWPNATWSQLTPQQPGSDRAPAPRRGHSAVILPHPDGPQMLVYGGRETSSYFGDIWLLDIASRSWIWLEQTSDVKPSPRDHHAVAMFGDNMVIFGGHTGTNYSHAHPANDLWAFNRKTLQWRQLTPPEPLPLPRFEHAYVQYTPSNGTEGSWLLVFAGQTDHMCQLNDVWELDLVSNNWTELSAPRFCTRECRHQYCQT